MTKDKQMAEQEKSKGWFSWLTPQMAFQLVGLALSGTSLYLALKARSEDAPIKGMQAQLTALQLQIQQQDAAKKGVVIPKVPTTDASTQTA